MRRLISKVLRAADIHSNRYSISAEVKAQRDHKQVQSQLQSLTCRRVDGRVFTEKDNPGIRIVEEAVDAREEQRLLLEVAALKEMYGFESSEKEMIVSLGGGKSSFKSSVSSQRVTGRPEHSNQVVAPWGYAEELRLELVPEALRDLVKKVRTLEGACMHDKNLRDITINYRYNSMFKLDPHVDPALDGGNVFILGLKSDVVLTLSPDVEDLAFMQSAHSAAAAGVRTSPAAVAARSWTDEDIDVLLRQRWMMHLSGAARHRWRHGIRAGLEVGAPVNGVCDWWGNMHNLVKRGNERVSIVLAFE